MCRECHGHGYVPSKARPSFPTGRPVAVFFFFVALGLGFWFGSKQFPTFREPLLYAAMATGIIVMIWSALFVLLAVVVSIKLLLSLRIVQYGILIVVIIS